MLKAVTVGSSRLYVYPTLKGLSREAKEVRQAFSRVQPDAVAVSLSDRELAEVMVALMEEDEVPMGDYVPESRRPGERSEEEDGGAPEEDDDGDEGGDDDEKGDDDEGGGEAGDDPLEEVEAPAGVVTREMVDRALDEPFHPDLVAADGAAAGDQIFVSDTDMTYSRKLAAFGEVELPPPSFREAARLAARAELPLEPIDLDDDQYTTVFCDHVSYWQLVRHSRKVRGMRRRLRARSPEELMLEWDRRLRELKGFDLVEGERERCMAANLVRLLERHRTVLAVIDMPRVEGVLADLAARMG